MKKALVLLGFVATSVLAQVGGGIGGAAGAGGAGGASSSGISANKSATISKMSSFMLDVTDAVVVFVDFQDSYMSYFDSGKFGKTSNFMPSSSSAAALNTSSGISGGAASGLSSGGGRLLQSIGGSGSSMSGGMANMTNASSSAIYRAPRLAKISDYWTNLQALVDLVAEFSIPSIITEFMNTTYGSTVPQIMSKLPNAVIVGRNHTSDVIAFNSKALLAAVQNTGKKNVIIVGLPGDFGLLYNCLVAKDNGLNVFAVIDASPAYDTLSESVALGRLIQQGINTITWFDLSRFLIQYMGASNANVLTMVNDLYSNFLPGFVLSNTSAVIVPSNVTNVTNATSNATSMANSTSGISGVSGAPSASSGLSGGASAGGQAGALNSGAAGGASSGVSSGASVGNSGIAGALGARGGAGGSR